MPANPLPLDAAARDELRAKAEALRAAITACPPFKFTIEPHVNGSAYLSDAQSEVWQAFMALTYACTPDVILALLAAVERGEAETARLEPHQRDALAWSIRYLRSGGTRPSPKQIDWAWDGVCALTPSEVLAYHAARAHPPIQETDDAEN